MLCIRKYRKLKVYILNTVVSDRQRNETFVEH